MSRNFPVEGAAPLDLVQDGTMLCYQRCVEEEVLGEGGLGATDGFPVGGAEVGAKC